MDKELIIARYTEDVSWVLETKIPTTIYNKGPNLHIDHPLIDVVPLVNRGREGETFIHHVVANRDHLADWSYFVQGDPHQPIEELWRRLEVPYTETTTLTRRYMEHFPIEQITQHDKVQWFDAIETRLGLVDHVGGRTPNQNRNFIEACWRQYFACQRPSTQYFGYGNSYAVPKANILGRTPEYWRWVRDFLRRDTPELTTTSAWGMETVALYLWGDAKRYPSRVIPTRAEVAKPKGCGCGKNRPRIKRQEDR